MLEQLGEDQKGDGETTTEQTLNNVLCQNEELNLKIQQYAEKEELLKSEAEGISDDNTALVKEINILRKELQELQTEMTKIRGNNKSLAVENNKT